MKLTKKSMTGIAALICFALMLCVPYFSDSSDRKEEAAIDVSFQNATAGVSMILGPEELPEDVVVDGKAAEVVAATMEDQETEDAVEMLQTQETEEAQQELKQDKSPWDDRLMVDIKESLNVRAKASKDAEVVGKMFPGSGAKILKDAGEWVKIKSGNVTGYIKKEYCVFGEEAEDLAWKKGCYYAVSTINGLRVRQEASTDGKILNVVEKGKRLTAKRSSKTEDGWVCVKYNDEKAYVSEEYVEIKLILQKAMTMKEYAAKIEQEQKAAQAAKEAKAASSSSNNNSSARRTQQSSVASNVDDVTLLAALIECEAGNQCYEGKLAVGAVVCNRIRSSRYPNNLRSVIYQSGQFGPASNGALARRLRGSIMSSCVRAAQEALSGVDNVNGALHFKSRRSGIDGIVIGAHVFY